jgi:hypothetical protein
MSLVPSVETRLNDLQRDMALLLMLSRAVSSAGDLGFQEHVTEAAWSRVGDPTPGSPYLANFKVAFARHRRFWLMGAQLEASGGFSIDYDQPIGKEHLVIKNVTDIGVNDVDRAIFAQEESEPRH